MKYYEGCRESRPNLSQKSKPPLPEVLSGRCVLTRTNVTRHISHMPLVFFCFIVCLSPSLGCMQVVRLLGVSRLDNISELVLTIARTLYSGWGNVRALQDVWALVTADSAVSTSLTAVREMISVGYYEYSRKYISTTHPRFTQTGNGMCVE